MYKKATPYLLTTTLFVNIYIYEICCVGVMYSGEYDASVMLL